MRDVGQVRRDAVVDEEPHRHGAEHFLCEPGRLRHDEKQRAADRRVGVARTAGQGVADAVGDGRIDFTAGPARIGERQTPRRFVTIVKRALSCCR